MKALIEGMGNFGFYLTGFGVGLNLIFIMGLYSGLGGWARNIIIYLLPKPQTLNPKPQILNPKH